ncbi:MAG: tol-pal system YbgF family protein [bacterium]
MRHNENFVIYCILIGFFILSCGQKATEEQLRAQAQLFEKNEKYEDALKAYEQQLEKYPKGKFADEALQKLAFLYYNNLNDFSKAIELHQRLIKDFPESKFVSQARFMVGYIYANDLKDYEHARKAYDDFLKYHSDSELAESVKWELEHLGQDINQQLQNLFSNDKANGEVKAN